MGNTSYPTVLSDDSHQFFLHSGSKKLIIFFAAQNMKPGKYNFFQMGQEIEENLLFVNDISNQWYQNGISTLGDTFEETIKTLKQWIEMLNIDEVYTLGTSMGGYAAIMYGVHLNANILSFAPEIILKTPYSRSKKKLRTKTKIHYYDLRELMKEYHKPMTVISGECDALDIYFSGMLTPTENLKIITLRGVDHYVPTYLTRASKTTKIIRTFYQLGSPELDSIFEVGDILKNRDMASKLYDAYIALQKGEYHFVEQIIDTVLDENKFIALAHYLKGSALLKVGHYEDGEKSLSTASLLAPKVPDYSFFHTHAVRMMGHEKESLYLLNHLLQKFPNFDKAHYAKGVILYKQHMFEEALANLNKAYYLNSSNVSYHRMRLKCLKRVNNEVL